MNQPLVSVIVPIYNVEKYLYRCLSSIKDQSYPNFEVIMINDGSTDSSRTIALNFQNTDNRFKLIDKENGGLSSGRNYGLSFVNGKYVCFVDSDDFLEKHYIEALLHGFTNDIDIVIGDYVIYDGKRKKAYHHGPQYSPGIYKTQDDKKKLLLAMFHGSPVMSVWKNMYRVSFLRDNHLLFVSERLVYAEDKLFHVEAYSLANGIKIVDDIIFYHLIIPGSLSQSYRQNYFEMHKELRSQILKIISRYYDPQFVSEYRKMIPSEIGGEMFQMSKCDIKEAVINIRKILNDEEVKRIYRNTQTESGVFRYLMLYKIGKLNSAIVVVCIAQMMQLCNPIYRRFQRKQEYLKKTERNDKHK